MPDQFNFKDRGTIITDDTKKEVLEQFNFSSLSISALDSESQPLLEPVSTQHNFTFKGANRRMSFRRNPTERRQKARFVGVERRVVHSRRHSD